VRPALSSLTFPEETTNGSKPANAMENKALREEAKRFLAQQAGQGSHLWATPSGRVSEEFDPRSTNSDGTQVGPDPGTAHHTSHTEPHSMADSTKSFERGAPEPIKTIRNEGQLEDPFPDFTTLDDFRAAICNCQKCPLGRTRNKFVFGVGDQQADLVVIGEAPGADEDAQGEPFVGRAGKLLDQILAAVNLKRGEGVYIANILKCRPPGNRDPLPSEVEECEPHLIKQLQLLRPKLIVALGRIAAQTLLKTGEPLAKLRGKVHDYHGIPLMVTFHPAALLRNPAWKRPTWEDVQQVRALLDEKIAESK